MSTSFVSQDTATAWLLLTDKIAHGTPGFGWIPKREEVLELVAWLHGIIAFIEPQMFSTFFLAFDLLKRWWAECFPAQPTPVAPHEVAALKWGGLDITSPHIDLLTCVLLRRTNWHKAAHMNTCQMSAKARRTGLCRARLPCAHFDGTVMEIRHPGCSHIKDFPLFFFFPY